MEAWEVLRDKNIKRTSCREGILTAVMQSGQALSESEIKDKLEACYDRTTFYRSFKTLEDSGLLHKVVIDSSTIKYAFGSIGGSLGHAHFYCQGCGIVSCIENLPLALPSSVAGLRVRSADYIIRGECRSCHTE
jgi:Fur family transcriptional regulator, ferric uptake regulator